MSANAIGMICVILILFFFAAAITIAYKRGQASVQWKLELCVEERNQLREEVKYK